VNRQNLTNFLLAKSNSNLLTIPVKFDNTSLQLTLGLSISQIVEVVSNLLKFLMIFIVRVIFEKIFLE
jgi:hypothetical protein